MIIPIETQPCMVCDKTSYLEVEEESIILWQNGALIQDVFPDLTPSQRELLLTGTHDVCWDLLFKEEDD